MAYTLWGFFYRKSQAVLHLFLRCEYTQLFISINGKFYFIMLNVMK